MPFVLASLLGGLLNIAGSFAGQMLIGLGIGVVTYSGISVTLGWAKDQMLQAIHGLPADMVGMLAYLGVGEYISIVTSAYVARLVLDGMVGGAMKKFVKK